MKVFFKTAVLIFTLLLAAQPVFAHKKIGITQILEHPSLNKIREKIVEVLMDSTTEDIEIIYENAQGSTATATQIAQKFNGLNLDLIIPISTPSAQAIVNSTKTTPVVFAAISDPIEAKIITSIQKPGGNVTGVMDKPPLNRQLAFIRQVIPDVKTIGVVYNPGEVNSVAMVRSLTLLAKQYGITIIPSTTTKSGDVAIASQALVGKVDVILIGNDNTVASGLEALIKVCNQNQIPLFMSDPDSVLRGAYAALAYDQTDIGRQVAQIALKVLSGKKPGDIPIEKPEKVTITFNEQTANNLKLPSHLREIS